MHQQFSQQRVDNLALLCHRQSQALRLRHLEALQLILAGLPVATLAASVSEMPDTSEFQVVPQRDRMVRIFTTEMAIH